MQDDVFNKIYLSPKSITFLHSPQKQIASLTITNYSSETIIFKMKSTRPKVYRMNPVYGIVEPRKEVDIRLTCKGLIESQPPQNERFTIVIAIAPPVNEVQSARKLWEIHKAKDPNAHETNKKRIPIEFLTEHTDPSLNEKAQVVEDPDDDIIRAPRARIRKKSRGGVEDDVGYTLDKTVTSNDTTGPVKAAKATHLEENSFSGEEQSRSMSDRESSTVEHPSFRNPEDKFHIIPLRSFPSLHCALCWCPISLKGPVNVVSAFFFWVKESRKLPRNSIHRYTSFGPPVVSSAKRRENMNSKKTSFLGITNFGKSILFLLDHMKGNQLRQCSGHTGH
ncbi:hypothetical protein Y032_0288g1481 [Ancylostoma ceylanicum]|nr:hypothetical protein Y032_0288g1481 [Ancylostoma ceylanicum]